VASVSSVTALQASVALAERQVQQDQTRVTQDATRLDQSRSQLNKDKQELNDTQQLSRAAQQPELKPGPTVQLDTALVYPSLSRQVAPSSEGSPPKPQLNAQGQTIGKLINIVA
jgi:hypothetical protein